MTADRMDPRQRRTRTRLHAVIHDLATAEPIDTITMADVARAAGVKRDTVYRHAASPVALLAQALELELDVLVEAASQLPASTTTGESVFRAATLATFQHVADHEAIYRNAMGSHLSAPIRDVLIRASERALAAHLERHPEIAPPVGGRAATTAERALFVAYAASGNVGVVEAWLAAGDLTDLESASAALTAAAPAWWHGR